MPGVAVTLLDCGRRLHASDRPVDARCLHGGRSFAGPMVPRQMAATALHRWLYKRWLLALALLMTADRQPGTLI